MTFFLKYWKAIALVVLLAVSHAGAFKLGIDREVASQAREDAKMEKVAQKATDAAVAAIGRIRIEHKQINRQAETIIRETPVYRDCTTGDDLVRLLDAARQTGEGGD